MLDVVHPQEVRSETDHEATTFARVVPVVSKALGHRILHFQEEPIGDGRGFSSRVSRIHLTYATEAPRAPRTLIVKQTADLPDSRQRQFSENLSEREALFYAKVTPVHLQQIRTPRCYFAGPIEGMNVFLIVLEDIHDDNLGDQLASADIPTLEAVVDSLARLHGFWWNSTLLNTFTWLGTPGQPAARASREDQLRWRVRRRTYKSAWANLRDREGEWLPQDIIQFGDSLEDSYAPVGHHLSQGPVTLTHGDFRLDNLKVGPRREVTIFDWQTVGLARGPLDLGHLLVGSLSPEIRRQVEHEMIDRYYSRLMEQGITDYSLDECRFDYRVGVINLFWKGVFYYLKFDFSHGRGKHLMEACLNRMVVAAHDLDLIHVLDDLS